MGTESVKHLEQKQREYICGRGGGRGEWRGGGRGCSARLLDRSGGQCSLVTTAGCGSPRGLPARKHSRRGGSIVQENPPFPVPSVYLLTITRRATPCSSSPRQPSATFRSNSSRTKNALNSWKLELRTPPCRGSTKGVQNRNLLSYAKRMSVSGWTHSHWVPSCSFQLPASNCRSHPFRSKIES